MLKPVALEIMSCCQFILQTYYCSFWLKIIFYLIAYVLSTQNYSHIFRRIKNYKLSEGFEELT